MNNINKVDVFRTHADISKISKMLKYRPLVNSEDGLKKTVEYFKKAWK